MKIKVVAVTAAAAAASLVAACSSGSAPSGSASRQSGPFTVLCVCASSGTEQAVDAAELAGMHAAANVLNKSGGVLGEHVVVDAVNDNSQINTGISALTGWLSGHPKPDLVVNGIDPEYTAAEEPVALRYGVLTITDDIESAGLNKPAKYPLAFGVVPLPTTSALAATDYFKAHHYTKVGLLEPDFSYGTGVISTVTASDKAAGITTVGITYPFETALNMTSQLQRLQAAKVQAVLFDGLGPQAGYLLKDVALLGWKVPLIGGTVSSTTDVTKLVPAADYKGAMLEVHPIQQYQAASAMSPAEVTFLNAVKTATNNSISQPIYLYGFGYDMVELAAYGAKQSKSTAASAIAHWLQQSAGTVSDPPWVVDTTLGFNATNHQANPGSGGWIFVPIGPQSDGMIRS